MFDRTDSRLWAAEGAGNAAAPVVAAPVVAKKPRARAAFDRQIASDLQEAQEIAATASDVRFAAMLNDEYEITPAEVTQLKTLIAQARQKFGLAGSGAGSGQADTAAKDEAENVLIAALRRIQTGARLTYPTSAANQARYFIGTDLELAEAQLVQISTTVLDNLTRDTLKSVTAAKIQAVRDALTAWQAALAAQDSSKGASHQDRIAGRALMDQIDPIVRQIKIAIDGEFPYTSVSTRPTRKLFHISETRPYTYVPHDQ